MRQRDLWSFWEELVEAGGDAERILDLIARRAAEVVGEATVIAVVSGDGTLLEPVTTFHADPGVLDFIQGLLGTAPARVGHGVAGTVAMDGRPVIVSDPDQTMVAEMLEPAYRPFLDRLPIRSLVIVPMVAYGEVIGTVGAVRTVSTAPYTEEDVMVLEALAERASWALLETRRPSASLGPAEYQAIFRHSIDGVLFTSPDGRVLAANPAACEILQRTEDEICRLGRAGLVVADDPRAQEAVRQRDLTGRTRAEFPMRRGDGSIFIADVSSTVFVTVTGDLRACVIFRDATEQVALRMALHQKSVELARLAEEDDLTNVRNRRGLLLAADQTLAFADREQVPVQVVFFDLDNLKGINDTFGHRAGDAAITALAAAISSSIRAVDVVARIGGDEFVALLYSATAADAAIVIDRVAEALRGPAGPGFPTTFTAGIAERPPGDPATLDELLDAADRQMYAVKLRRRLLPPGQRSR